MKFKVIKISCSPIERKWTALINKDEGERVKGRRKWNPSAMGYMYYWATESDEKAFEVLKNTY